jgi:hypothetical protein
VTPPPDLIEGWGAIAFRLSSRSGLDVSVNAAMRWAKRSRDPLPIRRWGAGRPRVVADAAALDAWCDRQWSGT